MSCLSSLVTMHGWKVLFPFSSLHWAISAYGDTNDLFSISGSLAPSTVTAHSVNIDVEMNLYTCLSSPWSTAYSTEVNLSLMGACPDLVLCNLHLSFCLGRCAWCTGVVSNSASWTLAAVHQLLLFGKCYQINRALGCLRGKKVKFL